MIRMKKAIVGFIVGAVIALTVTRYFPAAKSITQKEINRGMTTALLWMETSAEYRALCYQAYNTALKRIITAAENISSADKRLAIVMDIDETVLHTVEYEVEFLDLDENPSDAVNLDEYHRTGKPQPKAMPGAYEFLKAVDALSVDIFYLTNIPEEFRSQLVRNLNAINFPQVDNLHVVLMEDSNNKDPRLNRIAEKYNVILYLGDNVNDFPMNVYGKDMTGRNTVTDTNQALFGTQYIVFPNPVYGSWRGAYADGYWNMSLEDRHKSDMNALADSEK